MNQRGYGGVAGGNKETRGQLPFSGVDIPRTVRPRAEGLSAAEPSSRNWAALGLRVHAASLLHSTAVRLAGAAFTPAPEGALLCPASPPGPESWAGSRGGWASGPSAEPSLPLRSGTAARTLMCHRTLYWRETKEEDVMKGFDDWVVPPHGVTAGEGPVCSSF